jgi:hypothetical protein
VSATIENIPNGNFDTDVSGFWFEGCCTNVTWDNGEAKFNAEGWYHIDFIYQDNITGNNFTFDFHSLNLNAYQCYLKKGGSTLYIANPCGDGSYFYDISTAPWYFFMDEGDTLTFTIYSESGILGWLDNISNLYEPPPTDFTATGKVTFKDVDNTTHNLPGALVYFNSTLNDTTDSNGDYLISGIPNGLQQIFVVKNDAYNTDSGYVSNISTVKNFELKFSKPFMASPYVSGNYIKGKYSHNFKTLTLWENPNFMWGRYYFEDLKNTSNDRYYFKQCEYQGGNIFACEFINSRNHTFEFIYSDRYNSNLNNYHPTLTEMRNFTSATLYLFDNVNYLETDLKSISVLPQADRERILRASLPDIIFLLLIFVVVGMILSWRDKK